MNVLFESDNADYQEPRKITNAFNSDYIKCESNEYKDKVL